MYRVETLTISGSKAESGVVDIREAVTGAIFCPLISGSAIGFKAGLNNLSVNAPVYDENGALVTIPTTGGLPVNIPLSVMKHGFIKVWTCTTAGVDNNQNTGDKVFSLVLKG
jgi:hypothetical protein